MNTKIVWIVLVAIVIIGGAWYMLSAQKAAAPTMPENTAVESEGAPLSTESTDRDIAATVTLSDSGFSPATVTVNVGDTVRFVNASNRGMWVGSDDHPTHTNYDGTSTREHCANGAATNGTFDQCVASASGSSYEYTFEKSGTFGYHNHVGAASTGVVVVK